MDNEIYNIVTEYKKRLDTLGIKVKKIILYGSHAKGKSEEHSDIDLIVISNNFKDMDLWERLCLLGSARIGIKRPMEILGFTEDEFKAEKKGSFIGDEVKSKGIEIK